MELSSTMAGVMLFAKFFRKKFKTLFYIVLAIILFIAAAIPTYTSYWRKNSTKNTFPIFKESSHISFSDIIWENDYLGDDLIEKIAFYVPVKMKGMKGNFYMQFDSGTQTTLFYGKTLDKITNADNQIETYYNEDSLRYVSKPNLQIGENIFSAEKIRIAKTLGEDEIDTSFVVLGTIGFDIFVNRTLILDFKNDQLAITEKAAKDLDYKLQYIKRASVNKFPLIIPAKIGNKKTRLFYDTGSSMFSLLTSNKRLQKINNNRTDSLCCVNNWGNKLPVYRKKLDSAIKIGTLKFEDQHVYGCEVLDVVNYIPRRTLFGMTGNRLFDGSIVVIDTKHNMLGIEN